MIKKDVNIKLISTQSDGEDSSQTEVFTEGSYEKTAEGYRISYEESEATGFEGSTTTLETVGSSMVVMERTGQVSSNLVIDTKEKHHCVYGTPYGTFEVGVKGRRVDSRLSEDGGSLVVQYVVDVNSGYVGDFEVAVDVRLRQ
ncbi:MAG: DUF1934 domain-containing protein [Ruminococcus sp.]|nr:DUF1934 domain-containing protein [Ruminococcus sp.]